MCKSVLACLACTRIYTVLSPPAPLSQLPRLLSSSHLSVVTQCPALSYQLAQCPALSLSAAVSRWELEEHSSGSCSRDILTLLPWATLLCGPRLICFPSDSCCFWPIPKNRRGRGTVKVPPAPLLGIHRSSMSCCIGPRNSTG